MSKHNRLIIEKCFTVTTLFYEKYIGKLKMIRNMSPLDNAFIRALYKYYLMRIALSLDTAGN